MKIYVFGNKDLKADNLAFDVINHLKADFPKIDFNEIGLNKDLPFADAESVIILDTVEGINEVELMENVDLDKLALTRSSSVHDFDLGFQLKYLTKLGKLGKVTIIGIPMNKEIDYLRIQFILRKLVAQDMQGS